MQHKPTKRTRYYMNYRTYMNYTKELGTKRTRCHMNYPLVTFLQFKVADLHLNFNPASSWNFPSEFFEAGG